MPTSPRLGYPCMNLVLNAGTSGTLRLASIGDQEKLRGVVRRNLAALERILRFNAEHGVRLFRLGSQFIPFASHDSFPYDWRAEHAPELARLGALARDLGQRISMHPGQYVCCGSPSTGVVEKSVAELRYAADVLRLMGSEDGVVVVHVGGAYGDKPAAADRFVRALEGEETVRRYLALENDERVWAPHEVIPIAARLGVAAIVDTLHHRLNPGTLTLRGAVAAAAGTWARRGGPAGARGRPKLHISSQDPAKARGAHAYGVDAADWDGLLAVAKGIEVDVMIESKGKEQSLRALGLRTIPVLGADAETAEPASRRKVSRTGSLGSGRPRRNSSKQGATPRTPKRRGTGTRKST